MPMENISIDKIRYLFPNTIISNAKISPDGSEIAYSLTNIDSDKNIYYSNIWVQKNDKTLRKYTTGKNRDCEPFWSTDSSRIYFISNRQDNKQADQKPINRLWAMPTNGGEAEIVLDHDIQNPIITYCEDKILFKSEVDTSQGSVDSDIRVIKRTYYKEEGRGFLENKRNHIFTYEIKNKKIKQITNGDYDVGSVTLSPDGKTIAFTANMYDDADLSPYNSIYKIPTSGGKPHLIYDGKNHWSSIEWSPDGNKLALSGQEILDPTLILYKNSNIWLFPLNGTKPRNLTKNFDRSVNEDQGNIKWSNDSCDIYFLADDLGGSHIFTVDLTKKISKITDGKISVSEFSLGRKNEILYIASESNSLQELWIQVFDKPLKLTSITDYLLKGLTISEPEEFWFKNKEGVPIQGWIIKPTIFTTNKKYPTILSIHGGPFAAYNYGLKDEFQVLADNGYGVVYINPRGSTGYGQRFAECLLEDFQEPDFNDLMEAIDYVTLTYNWIDQTKLGVIGGSYGGSMTTWIIGRSKLFKAAISERGYSNLISFVGTSDTAWNGLPQWIAGREEAWDNPMKFMEKSPLTYIRNIETPVLLIYAENDSRNPIEQGEQIYTGLKKLRKTVEFLRFPNEGHGLPRTGSPKHRKERLIHIIRWFDKYLK
jgi:dipeptidyl aminopeptidase/acylaminoacyl peptidase